jgi:spore coat protein YsxE
VSLVTEDENQKNDVHAVLRNYALQILHIESFGKITKIYGDKGIFALKSISPKHGIDFIYNIKKLYQRGYNRIVPIYQTLDGRYAVLHDHRLYYLMPWLSNEESGERTERNKQMLRELARMHSLSVKDLSVEKEERQEHYEKTIGEWKKQQEFLEEYLIGCEKKWYMSPFELMVCMYYTDLTQALAYSIKKIEAWFEKTKDDEKVRIVVTHGNVSPKHYLYDDRGHGHFINFEQSKTAPPHVDLLPFMMRVAKTYPHPCDDCIDLLYNYMRYFPLKSEEILLFQSYLAYPIHAINCIKKYVEKKNSRSELEHVSQLQRIHWLVKNIEYISIKIEEIEKAKNAAAEAEQEKSAE